MTAAKRTNLVPVHTTYGDGYLAGYDDKGQANCIFKPGAAPELEPGHWKGGPCYSLMIPAEAVIGEIKEGSVR